MPSLEITLRDSRCLNVLDSTVALGLKVHTNLVVNCSFNDPAGQRLRTNLNVVSPWFYLVQKVDANDKPRQALA